MSNNPYRQPPSSLSDYTPPPGPPPSHQQHHQQQPETYLPPPGPPPSYQDNTNANSTTNSSFSSTLDYQSPPGPPPPKTTAHPAAWELAVPDTSLFPPPPALFSGHTTSSATNASEASANQGEKWCKQHPLAEPVVGSKTNGDGDRGRQVKLVAPPLKSAGYGGIWEGTVEEVVRKEGREGGARGVWRIETERGSGDGCLMGWPPVYKVNGDSPLTRGGAEKTGEKGREQRHKTIYYEVVIAKSSPTVSTPATTPHRFGFRHRKDKDKKDELGKKQHQAEKEEIGVAIGFSALPYPTFRMPGWHRGSLAVHGDDGRKYVNDRWGGRDFTDPFVEGGVYGIGMVFSAPSSSSAGDGVAEAGRGIEMEVFFTKDGQEVGRWGLHEETDAEQDLPVTGLEGHHDLCVAVGTYGEVHCDVVLDPSRWAFKGLEH